VIRNAINDWPALKLWQDYDYLKSKIGKKIITVAITPNGYADAVQDKFFTTPHYQMMKMEVFLDILRGKTPKNPQGVYYIQKQNSNFIEEFREIHCDAPTEIPWASEAFGTSPDAVNFWMGEEQAVTSMHKDHYENIYTVVSGEKHFILHPPTDIAHVPYGKQIMFCYLTCTVCTCCSCTDVYRSAHYELNVEGQLHVVEDDGPDVPWVSVDPLDPDLQTHPQYANATPIHCTLKAGEVLYLPSLWFHHLRQSHGAIAVNFWYDMEFGFSYCYYKLLESLTQPKLNKFKIDCSKVYM
jgi:jumonji domain-containing protein 7